MRIRIKYLLTKYLLITKGKHNFKVEKTDRYHLYEVMKVTIISNKTTENHPQ